MLRINGVFGSFALVLITSFAGFANEATSASWSDTASPVKPPIVLASTSSQPVLITAPLADSTVSGTVAIILQQQTPVADVKVFIDGVFLASTPQTSLEWDTTRSPMASTT